MTAGFATVKKSHNDWETQPRNHGLWGNRDGGKTKSGKRKSVVSAKDFKRRSKILCDVLESGHVSFVQNPSLGSVAIRKDRIEHIIKRRYAERVLNKKVRMPCDEAKEEISELLCMILEAIETEKAVQDVSGRWSVEKNGVRAILGKDSKGRYLLTGFNDHRKEKTATDSIRAGIAAHRYKHGFPEIYAQVGAVVVSIESSEESAEKSSKERDSVKKSWWCWFDGDGRLWFRKSTFRTAGRG